MSNEIKWSLDQAHSEISFKIKHLMISHVSGSFKIFDASIYTTGKDFSTAEIDLWIDPSSISTGDAKRDEHLRGTDFFDVEKYKEITFGSSTIGQADAEGNHELWGELTLKGVTKNLKLNVAFGGMITDPWGKEKAGFTVTGKISRKDWGLTYNAAIETGGVVLGDEVSISCEIEVANEGPKEEALVLETEERASL